MRLKDTRTADMFELLPPPAVSMPGSLECRKQIASIMSEQLHGLDRYLVAAEMSKLLGPDREVTKAMLDAYTSEARESHIPPLDKSIAFDIATNGFGLINFYAAKMGARVLVGKDALHAELGKIDREIDQATKRKKELKKAMGEVE